MWPCSFSTELQEFIISHRMSSKTFYSTTLPEKSYQKTDWSWPWAGHCVHCPAWLLHVLCPHPLHLLNLLVPVANVFLPCFFLSLFCQRGSGSCGWGCPSQGKNNRNRTHQLEVLRVLSPTFKFFDALVVASPLVTISRLPQLLTFFLLSFSLASPCSFQGSSLDFSVRPAGETSRNRDHKKAPRKN